MNVVMDQLKKRKLTDVIDNFILERHASFIRLCSYYRSLVD